MTITNVQMPKNEAWDLIKEISHVTGKSKLRIMLSMIFKRTTHAAYVNKFIRHKFKITDGQKYSITFTKSERQEKLNINKLMKRMNR